VSHRLVQISGAIADLIYRVEAVPVAGQEAIVHGATMAAGGGFNAMVAARRFGMDVVYGGTLGSGPFADMVAKALDDEGIVRLRPRLESCDQGSCVVLVDGHGERTFIASQGADGIVSVADLARLDLRAGDWVLLSGYALYYDGSRDALTTWLQDMPEGIRLVFDPSPMIGMICERARRAALAHSLWISANVQEAMSLTGTDEPARAARMLADGRPGQGGAVVRDGANGCFLALSGQAPCHLPAFPVETIDTNGAGDIHIGVFIATLASGQSPFHAAHLANIAAALSTTREGPSMAPTRAVVSAAEALGQARVSDQKRSLP